MPSHFRIRVRKEELVFSAAHFITFGENICERLHGHNYGVEVEVVGPLRPNGYVMDFMVLRATLREICQQLDHHVLLPDRHPAIHVEAVGREVVTRFEGRRWVFPEEDCVILPIANTTAELLAEWIGEQLRQSWSPDDRHAISEFRVAVDENHGQWGIHEWVADGDPS